jgi:phosphatidylinositol alpha 1,6-mannosyltransferase
VSLRVAVVTESFLPALNGVTNSVVRVLESLKANGHEAIVLAPTSNSNEFLGFKVIQISRFYIKQFAVALPHIRLEKILREFNPDVIHVAAPFAFGRQAISVAHRMGVPAIAIYQTDIAGYAQRYGLPWLRPIIDRLIGAIHQRATVNLAPTIEGADYLRAIGANGVAVWGRGVDLENYHPLRRDLVGNSGLRKELGAPGHLIVGFVGRLAAEKQVERLAELFGIPNVSFLIVGDGPERKNLEKLFAYQKVKFTGKLVGPDLANAYASMDIFIHCGTEETFGQTIQEAQASGLPVVAPARGGLRFLIQSGRSGILVNPDDENAYRNAVQQLIDNPDLRRAIGLKARTSVSSKSWAANNAQLFEHYRNAIEIKGSTFGDKVA